MIRLAMLLIVGACAAAPVSAYMDRCSQYNINSDRAEFKSLYKRSIKPTLDSSERTRIEDRQKVIALRLTSCFGGL